MEKSLRWDIFCKVIDNFGDIGVCLRLSLDLCARGHAVRLWVDDPTALDWMVADTPPGLEVIAWVSGECSAQDVAKAYPDVVIEGFGCEPEPAFLNAVLTLAHQSAPARTLPVWINLEYLSAESYVQRSHRLPSWQSSQLELSAKKYFFYPGFVGGTGGLIRETSLTNRRDQFDRAGYFARLGLDANHLKHRCVSLFCYQNAPIDLLFEGLAAQVGPGKAEITLLVCAGQATTLTENYLAKHLESATPAVQQALALHHIHVHYVQLLTQEDYDHLLWSCELNFVRGEDSLVRALWAEVPFIWQLYPQDDNAHWDKLDAFCHEFQLNDDWVAWLRSWNRVDLQQQPAARSTPMLNFPKWRKTCHRMCERLKEQPDLTHQLLEFVFEKR